MTRTCQSEYLPIETLFLKRAGDAFLSEAHLSKYWGPLNYLSKPDYARAVAEYSLFERFFRDRNIDLHFFPESSAVTMDSVYCRDAAIATNHGMIIGSMGKAARIPEPHAQQEAFEQNGFTILGTIQLPGTLEGGDTAWLDEKTLAVGYSYRTNAAGIRQLTELLQPFGISTLVVDLPHYKGPSDVFHLMSVLSPVDEKLAVVYSPLLPISFRNELLDRGFGFVEVPESEFESMGCNVLAISPRECLMVAGNPVTENALREAGCTVNTYAGSDISVKGGGGPTCLTRPVWRTQSSR